MATSWHYALRALDPPGRPVAFQAQPDTRPRARQNQTETFFSQSTACRCASCHHHLMKRPAFWPGLLLETNQRAHAPLPGMLETENMNADQGFRRAPGNLLRVAAGAGAAALIAAAVSAARRARTATADRDSGSAHDQVSPSGIPAPEVPEPEVPEAVKTCDPAVRQVAISAALLLVS